MGMVGKERGREGAGWEESNFYLDRARVSVMYVVHSLKDSR